MSVTFAADSESTTSAGSVWNVESEPVTDPRVFVATTWKWYVVAVVRPLSCAFAGASPTPAPRSDGLHGTVVAFVYPLAWNVASSTYWKSQSSLSPAG